MERSKEITQQMQQICLRILRSSRNELYLNMRFLDLALSGLEFKITTELRGIGTDGMALYVHPKLLADWYEEDRKLVNRAYLHCVYHCLFRHLLKSGRYPERLWNIACNMAVEALIDGMTCRSVRMGCSHYRRNWYEQLQKECRVLTAEGICHYLIEHKVGDAELEQLEREFGVDDHSLWPKTAPPGTPPPPQMEMLQNKWQDISEKTQTEMETFAKESAEGAGDLLEEMQIANRERYDYRSFLRKFAVMKEEMQVDPDTFDYVFYCYGLSLYGNMPLLEPQEYREVKKIEEFVIVIDVSMSCSGALVQSFLEQTYSVLSESETYLKKVNIRILQCDEKVQADEKITSQAELKNYMEHFTLTGNGGTDFRPAFVYVDELLEQKQFQNLKGLLYFTDGYGTFPKRRPVYDTAFVFLEEDYTDAAVPPWAIKLILEKEDLEPEKGPGLDRRFVWEEDQN